jgi:hypothetical protein
MKALYLKTPNLSKYKLYVNRSLHTSYSRITPFHWCSRRTSKDTDIILLGDIDAWEGIILKRIMNEI